MKTLCPTVVALLAGIMASGTPAAGGEGTKPSAPPIDLVVVVKSKHTLTLLSKGRAVRNYKVALGTEPIGAKRRIGDHKTPEGRYVLDRRNPNSHFYKAIHISYPNEEDRRRAAQHGVNPGGEIMIHGLPNGFGRLGAMHRARDWTDGCIAVTDEEMDEIWKLVRDGTPIDIRP